MTYTHNDDTIYKVLSTLAVGENVLRLLSSVFYITFLLLSYV